MAGKKSAPPKKGTPKTWTNKEVRKMVAMRHNGASVKRIARELDRSLCSVGGKLRTEGEKRPTKGAGSRWQPCENDVMYAEYPRLGVAGLFRAGLLPSRSKRAIANRASLLGITVNEDHPRYKSSQNLKSQNLKCALDPDVAAKRLLERGFKLVEEYAGTDTPIVMEHIACGARERKRPGNIFRGRGCLACCGRKKTTIGEANEWLRANDLPIRTKEGVDFACTRSWGFYCLKEDCGFAWETKFSAIKNCGTRCPKCSEKTWKEAYIYEVARELLRDGLTAARGKYRWLVHGVPREILNEEGNPLQLDIFIWALNIAFAIEVQGRQHYEEVLHWGGPAALARRRRDDERKRQECLQLGITLWEIDLRDFQGSEKKIKKRLRRHIRELLRGAGLV